MPAPGISAMMAEFKLTSRPLATFAVSIYILGLALGPMLVVAFSYVPVSHKFYLLTKCKHSQGPRTVVRDLRTPVIIPMDKRWLRLLLGTSRHFLDLPSVGCPPIPSGVCRLGTNRYRRRYHRRSVPARDSRSSYKLDLHQRHDGPAVRADRRRIHLSISELALDFRHNCDYGESRVFRTCW